MDVKNLYNKRFKYNIAEKNDLWRVLCNNFFQKYIPINSTVVDLGAGYCEFINNIDVGPLGKKIVIDLNEDIKDFANNDVILYNQNIIDVKLEDSSCDIIFMSNFLEHITDKEIIITIFNKCNKFLRPNGSILILQPDIRFVGNEYWNFFDHHLPLSVPSLKEALSITGFTVDVVIDKFLPYTTKSAIPQYPFLVYLYLKCPIAWKILGKQCFIIAHPEK
jgi:SAM-dependent methyltransferase